MKGMALLWPDKGLCGGPQGRTRPQSAAAGARAQGQGGHRFLPRDLGASSRPAAPGPLCCKVGSFGGFSDLEPRKHLAQRRRVVSLAER